MQLKVVLRPSLVAYLFHLCFTIPYVKVDNAVTHVKWGTEQNIQLGEGAVLSAGFSYKGMEHQRLAETQYGPVGADDGRIVAKLGPFNMSPFSFKIFKSN